MGQRREPTSRLSRESPRLAEIFPVCTDGGSDANGPHHQGRSTHRRKAERSVALPRRSVLLIHVHGDVARPRGEDILDQSPTPPLPQLSRIQEERFDGVVRNADEADGLR